MAESSGDYSNTTARFCLQSCRSKWYFDQSEFVFVDIRLIKTDKGLELLAINAEESITIIKGKKAALLSVWATNCSVCRRDLPNLEKVYKKFKDKGLLVLGVNIDANPDAIKAYNQKHQLTFNSVLDAERKITRAYNANLTPTNYLINLNTGKVEVVYQGIATNMLTSVEADVTALLDNGIVANPAKTPKASGGAG